MRLLNNARLLIYYHNHFVLLFAYVIILNRLFARHLLGCRFLNDLLPQLNCAYRTNKKGVFMMNFSIKKLIIKLICINIRINK
nr:MAG TPA: hypothetical protein [Caudoviricetes sp.]